MLSRTERVDAKARQDNGTRAFSFRYFQAHAKTAMRLRSVTDLMVIG